MTNKPLRILYVEDNPLVREVTCELLAQPTRQILATASAEEALDVFKRDAFDVVLTDVSLLGHVGIGDGAPNAAVVTDHGHHHCDGLQIAGRPEGPRTPRAHHRKTFDAPAIDSLLDELCRESGRA
jgi:CheY-like chemotaxis protein